MAGGVNHLKGGISGDSDLESMAGGCRLSVLHPYCGRIASVTTDVGPAQMEIDASPESPLARNQGACAAVCEDGGLAHKNDPVDRF